MVKHISPLRTKPLGCGLRVQRPIEDYLGLDDPAEKQSLLILVLQLLTNTEQDAL